MEKSKKAVSVFAYVSAEKLWAEYVVVYSYGTKKNNPIKFIASLVWRSSTKSSFTAGMKGSFSSEKEAYGHLRNQIERDGGEIVRMTKKTLSELEAIYNYPNGRHPYVLEHAVI